MPPLFWKLEEANAELEEANADLEEANIAWVETNQLRLESNRILELGISHIIVDTLNLTTTRRGQLTAVGLRQLKGTIGRLVRSNIIHKRGQFSNWVLINYLTLEDLRNIIRG